MGTVKANSKPIVLNGVGEAYTKRITDGKVELIKMGTLQDLKLSFSASDEKVYGGDALVPIYIITKEQSVNVSATEATFNLEYLKVTNGAKQTTGQYIFNVPGTLIASGTEFTVPGSLTTIVPESVIVTISDDARGLVNAKTLLYKASSPSAGQFTITKAGVVTLGESVTDKYISVNGVYEDENGYALQLDVNSNPQFVEIRHKSHPVDMGDGKKVIIHTIIPMARATGKLDIDHKRQEAHAPQLEFEVMYDTSRTDDRIMTISQEVIEVAK